MKSFFCKFPPLILIVFLVAPSLLNAHVGIPSSPTTSCGSIDSVDFGTHVTNQINDRVTGVLSSAAMDMFSLEGDQTAALSGVSTAWTRNTPVWSDVGTNVDWTGVSPWHQPYISSNTRYQMAGTLISPRHVILANHYRMPVDSTLLFVTNTNELVYRTLSNVATISGTDIIVGLLDSDVPDSVTYYPLIDESILESLVKKFEPTSAYDIPMVVFDQEKKAIVHSLTGIDSSIIMHTPYTTGDKGTVSETIVSGDSGQPGFIVVDGRPILLFAHYSASFGPNLGNYISQINSAMTTLGGGYQVTEYDPTCFTEYVPNNIPVFTSSSSFETLAHQNSSDTIYTYTATDADALQTISYSMQSLSSVSSTTLSLNPATYFTLHATTGVLKQIADFDNLVAGNRLQLVVTATDNGSTPATKSVTTNIDIDYPSLINVVRLGSTIELEFSNTLDGTSIPATSDFAVLVNGVTRSLSSVTIIDSHVNIFMSSSVSSGDTITLTYTPGTNKIKDTNSAYASRITNPLSIPDSQAGDLDSSFTPGTGANDSVFSMDIQSDGKILIGGVFTSYNGTTRNHIARLNTDGSLDTSFDPGVGPNGHVISMEIQSDGKIIVSGNFTTFAGVSSPSIARLNTDGSVDTSFVATGTGLDTYAYDIRIQSDGKIVIGGQFTAYNGTARSRIARLNTNGSLDTSFDPGTGPNNEVHTVAIQSDGKIIIGGIFNAYNGVTTKIIVRLNTDGTLDNSFVDPTDDIYDYIINIRSIKILQNGKIFIGGDTPYTHINPPLALLNSDGSLYTLSPNDMESDTILDLIEQSDGKLIVVGGAFVAPSRTMMGIIRFDGNLTLDETFSHTTGLSLSSGYPYEVLIDEDENIYVGGVFTAYNGVTRNNVVKIIGITETDITSPTITNVTSSTSNATKYGGQTVSIQVVFDEAVTVTGSPVLALETGSIDTNAVYASGSGSSTLTFTYTVASTDSSSDLDYKSITSLSGGTIEDDAENSAVLILPIPGNTNSLGANKSLVIDGIAPELFTVSIIGDTITFIYDSLLDDASIPSSGDFVLTKNGTTITSSIESIAISEYAMTMTLEADVLHSDTLVVTYTPGVNPIKDESGNSAGSISTESIVNNTQRITTTTTTTSGGGGRSGSRGGGGGGGTTPVVTPTNPLAATSQVTTVKQLQSFLNTHGFTVAFSGYGSIGNETTFFGPATKRALLRFQVAAGLVVSGLFDTNTRLYIANLIDLQNKPKEINQIDNTKNREYFCTANIYLKEPIKLGKKNDIDDVKLLQTFLNTYEGYSLQVDGVYKVFDYISVIAWQEKYAEFILKPFALTRGTGYVHTQSLKKIKDTVINACTTKN